MQTTESARTGRSLANRFLRLALLGACAILFPSLQAKADIFVDAGVNFEQYGTLDLNTGVFTRTGFPVGMAGSGEIGANLYAGDVSGDTYSVNPANGRDAIIGTSSSTFDTFGSTNAGVDAVSHPSLCGEDVTDGAIDTLNTSRGLATPTGVSMSGLSPSHILYRMAGLITPQPEPSGVLFLITVAAVMSYGLRGRYSSRRTRGGEMRRPRWATLSILTALAGILLGARPACAQKYYALEYWGGPVLETFTIYPLYYGAWSEAEIDAQQAYLTSLTAYISGQNAPAGQQPMIRQYGVNSATLVAGQTASPSATPRTLSNQDVLNIIHDNQATGKFPAYGPNSLLVVFPAHGFTLKGCNGCSYHSSESTSKYYAVVPADTGPTLALVTAHEVFEAATDPAQGDKASWGWLTGNYYPAGAVQPANDEMVDECGNNTITLSNLGIQIPEGTDNTGGVTVGNPGMKQPPGGTCSTTGYTSINETQVYGYTYSDYRAKYNTLWSQGWRLYSLQSYVLSTGAVLYNAVWRPGGNTSEIQDYGVSYARFRSDYDTLYPQGWRVYILQSYVMPNGDVLYNAVWRPGDLAERQLYGVTYAQFRSEYDTLYSEGWRVNILQSYVLPNGDVLYNAVWRLGDNGERQVYGYTYSDFLAKYNTLFPEGWRLYILDAYVISDGTVRYNAVWRPGTHAETQVYDWTYTDFLNHYNMLFPEGWRLYILNAYVLPGDNVRYDAVWRLGTIDRPL